ncbi:MAG TPA: SGNH/GDSL hydrolase family protein, partial [Armatimonadota bacterium]
MQRLQRFSLVLLLLCLGVAGAWAQGGKLLVTPGARVAIVGDSITEQKIYSRFIEAYLTACVPQLDAHAMQFGWGGDRTVMFARRMANDALPFHPTLVTLCFGMNDGGYRAFTPETGKAFQDPLLAIVTNFKAAGATVLVGSPGAVDSNAKYFRNGGTPPAVYNETLGKLGELAKATADAQGMPYANLHDTMMDAMAKTKAALGEDADVCGTDGVHPGWNGHLIMAYAFLKAMGFDGDLGTITIDVTGKATAENGHKILAVTGRKVDIESTRYPFIVPGAAADKRSARAMLPYLPFNQDLNRLTLV